MTIELNPVGMKCNLICPYCYENPMRDAGNLSRGYDLEKMKVGLLAEGVGKDDGRGGKVDFSLFGGEPLLMKWDDLVDIVKWGHSLCGKMAIQTNGTLITPSHVELFKTHNVHVGMSLDGPDELNDSRWAGSLEKTRINTAKSMEAIEMLCAAGIPPSIIVTLYRGNALPEPRKKLQAWLLDIHKKGVWSIRLHMLEVDHESVRENMSLTQEESIDAVLDMLNFHYTVPKMDFDLFRDIAWLQKGQDQQVSCVWNACDPYTTEAVSGVDGDGTRSNCGMGENEGINWLKAPVEQHIRQLVLYNTPQEHGGCKDCRFFVMCKGECPGTGLGKDWRNRSDMCQTWKALFGRYEAILTEVGIQPISLHPRLKEIEQIMLSTWESGRNVGIYHVLQHLETSQPLTTWGGPKNVNSPHLNVPHQNKHNNIPHKNIHNNSDIQPIIGVAPVYDPATPVST